MDCFTKINDKVEAGLEVILKDSEVGPHIRVGSQKVAIEGDLAVYTGHPRLRHACLTGTWAQIWGISTCDPAPECEYVLLAMNSPLRWRPFTMEICDGLRVVDEPQRTMFGGPVDNHYLFTVKRGDVLISFREETLGSGTGFMRSRSRVKVMADYQKVVIDDLSAEGIERAFANAAPSDYNYSVRVNSVAGAPVIKLPRDHREEPEQVVRRLFGKKSMRAEHDIEFLPTTGGLGNFAGWNVAWGEPEPMPCY